MSIDAMKTDAAKTDAARADFTDLFPDEVITMAMSRDITLPRGAGTFVLITLDNGFDHTKPNTFGPATLSGLSGALSIARARAEAGEIVGVGLTGKPFIFAVGADLTGIPRVADRAQALAIGRRAYAAWHRNFTFVWRQRGGAPHTMMFPEDFDALLAQGKALCGSPATVRAQLGAGCCPAGGAASCCRTSSASSRP